MCGIAGYISRDREIDRTTFEKMVDIIEHRGPDSRGTYYDNKLALGHRRLAIIDTSSAGQQPFVYNEKYIVVFNGEIYNYIELRNNLESEGYVFNTKSDTEVLVASYDKWGSECVSHFNGMWAFAIYDKEKQIVFCSRDRFGVKPFYYCDLDNMFLFGSEIKQILCFDEVKAKANRDRLYEYLIWGSIDFTNETMFESIFQLRPGENLLYDLSRRSYIIQKYYEIKISPQKGENCFEKFRSDFFESVKLRLRADVPVGYCLSGGLDSSAIVSVADNLSASGQGLKEQHTITSCFDDERYDEREYANEVIDNTNVVPHYVFPDVTHLFDDLDKIIWHMDEPFGSTSIYAQWNVFKAAADNKLKVMLDGQGADEQLAGYTNFYMVYFVYLIRKMKWVKLLKEIREYVRLRSVNEKHISAKNLIIASFAQALMPSGIRRFLIPRMYKGVKSPFPVDEMIRLAKKRQIYNATKYKQYFHDSIYCGMQELLHYEDRDSMAFSVESRVPFLDYRLVETIAKIPFEEKISDGITKSVLRKGLEGVLPDKIRTRYSKLGFVTPEDQWIQDNPDLFRNEIVNACDKLSGIIDTEQVMSWYDDIGCKIKRGDFTVWRIICAAHWVEIFNVTI